MALPDTRVHLIVFSKDRPLQLHGMLTSVFRHWRGDFKVAAIVRADNAYNRANAEALDECGGTVTHWHEHPSEGAFERCLTELLEGVDAPYVCFGCDDVVYTLPVDVDEVAAVFAQQPSLLGYSLRLGKHTEADMFGRPMPQPSPLWSPPAGYDEYGGTAPEGLRWDAAGAGGDWGYPWEVLGTVYRTDFVRRMVALLGLAGQAPNPSLLEHWGSLRWREAAPSGEMACGWSAHLVVPTVNLVQDVFGNGVVGGPGLDAGFLLDCWNRGLRLDVERYRGMAPPSWRIGDFFLKRAA